MLEGNGSIGFGLAGLAQLFLVGRSKVGQGLLSVGQGNFGVGNLLPGLGQVLAEIGRVPSQGGSG